MEIVIRDFRADDARALLEVYRDSYDGLRQSRGGMHPDSFVEFNISRPDGELLSELTFNSVLIVAQDAESGEIVGLHGFNNGLLDRLSGSAYSKALYVKRSHQRGRAGVNVGSMLRKELISRAASMGFRKLYGYSTPEAVGFHSKFGAVFRPLFDYRMMHGGTAMAFRYYELVLRKSPLNVFPIEPLSKKIHRLYLWMLRAKRAIFG